MRGSWLLFGAMGAAVLVACSTTDDAAAPSGAKPGEIVSGNPQGKDDGGECKVGFDCKSGVCNGGGAAKCAVATSADKVRNGSETGLDCGGADAPPCGGGQSCKSNDDCASKACNAGKCGGPVDVGTHTDGKKNLDESDVDCGGKTAPGCAADKACATEADCADKVCAANACVAARPDDGVKNADESDVDCGGAAGAPKCVSGKACVAETDCESSVCTGNSCKAPTSDDAKKNGDESDVDCGGTTTAAPKCDVAKGCTKHEDCASDACGYEKKCVAFKGCTGHSGGNTCGADGAATDDCCTPVAITDRPANKGGPFSIDRYQVTAGRMRAFLDRYDGNLQAWAATNPAGWNQGWTAQLPTSYDDANYLLGPYEKRGCRYNGEGGHTFWMPPVDEGGGVTDHSDFSKDVLDEKTLNCLPWYMAQAVCSFDGRRLATQAEITWSFENQGRAAGKTTYPWQWQDTSAYDPVSGDDRLAHNYSYGTPNAPANLRLVNNSYPLDHTFYIAPPGRHPKGVNMYGVQDMAGNVLSWTNDGVRRFTWTMSWEQHQKNLTDASVWNAEDGPMGYYAIGARCAK